MGTKRTKRLIRLTPFGRLYAPALNAVLARVCVGRMGKRTKRRRRQSEPWTPLEWAGIVGIVTGIVQALNAVVRTLMGI